MTNDPVYLDHNATTPVAPEVADAIAPFLREHFGNPSSCHVYGQRAKQAVEQARGEVAALLGAAAEEIVFTGSAYHAADHAVSGVLGAMGASPERAAGAVRLSVGTGTTPADIDRAARALISAWQQLRS